jgi:hypothetical protein
VIKKARVINLSICGILYLRRYGINFHRHPKTPTLVMMPPLVAKMCGGRLVWN